MSATPVSKHAADIQSTQTVETPIGKLDFENGVPTKKTVTQLYDEMGFQRACQLYLWALPVVGSEQMQVMQEATTGALPGDITRYPGYRNCLERPSMPQRRYR